MRPVQIHVPDARVRRLQTGSWTDPRPRYLRQVHASPQCVSATMRARAESRVASSPHAAQSAHGHIRAGCASGDADVVHPLGRVNLIPRKARRSSLCTPRASGYDSEVRARGSSQRLRTPPRQTYQRAQSTKEMRASTDPTPPFSPRHGGGRRAAMATYHGNRGKPRAQTSRKSKGRSPAE